MYSNEKSVQIILSLLKEYGITEIVLSPGGSDAPIVKSFESDNDFKCYSVVDERNAVYMAMGMAQELNKPVACVCTSGTAVSNYLPGITEAYYQNIPIVAITSDGLPCLLNQLELQKINQIGIFNNVVNKEVSLPSVQNELDEWYCNRLVNEALLALNHHGKGPVHINVPITLTLECSTPNLPKERVIHRTFVAKADYASISKYLENKKIMVVVGENLDIDKRAINIFNNFFSKYNCIFSVETVSNLKCDGAVITYPATETGHAFHKPELIPDIVISIGNFVSTYRMKEILRNNKNSVENWLISECGEVRDPYYSLTHIFEGAVFEFFEMLQKYSNTSISNNSYYQIWKNEVSEIDLKDIEFSSLSIAKALSKSIPENSVLHTAILNSTRITQFFDFQNNIKCYSNLGSLGIDGCVPTFIGHSMVTENLSYLLIGDLSFFYGMNAIGIREIKNNVRIILLNNGGGEEFKIKLPYDNMDNFICAQNNHTAKGWVESLGFKYYSVSDNDSLEKTLEIFAQESDSPMFLEIFLDIDKDAKIIRDIYLANNNTSIVGKVKSKINCLLHRPI